VGKVRVRDAGTSGLSGKLEDAVGVERRATQVAPERLEQGELSLAVGTDDTCVRDPGRGSATSEGVRGLVQPSCEQLQGPQMRVEQDGELGELSEDRGRQLVHQEPRLALVRRTRGDVAPEPRMSEPGAGDPQTMRHGSADPIGGPDLTEGRDGRLAVATAQGERGAQHRLPGLDCVDAGGRPDEGVRGAGQQGEPRRGT
jgi:hypothetical protein